MEDGIDSLSEYRKQQALDALDPATVRRIVAEGSLSLRIKGRPSLPASADILEAETQAVNMTINDFHILLVVTNNNLSCLEGTLGTTAKVSDRANFHEVGSVGHSPMKADASKMNASRSILVLLSPTESRVEWLIAGKPE